MRNLMKVSYRVHLYSFFIPHPRILIPFLCASVVYSLHDIAPPSSQRFAPFQHVYNEVFANTNWQGYGGEVTMAYVTQMLGLNVQNFVSAATGMAVLVALIRGLRGRSAETIGNFWVDLTRSILYILLPLSIILALFQVSQGVVQNFNAYQTATMLQGTVDGDGNAVTEQTLPMGPAASQIAIKQLGTNGGGFFNVNSAHPFENPTPLSNFFEMLAILLIPAALCYTFGKMVGDTRQGWAVLIAMTVIFVPLLLLAYGAEAAGNPRIAALGVDTISSEVNPGGNMEGKEVRFGIAASANWAAATTAASRCCCTNHPCDCTRDRAGLGDRAGR
jgi:K+-transporting ATPase ATPase A chain